MDRVVDALEGPGVAAVRVAEDLDAIVPEVGIELCDVLEVGVGGLPVGVGLACLERDGGVQAGLPYKNERQSNF